MAKLTLLERQAFKALQIRIDTLVADLSIPNEFHFEDIEGIMDSTRLLITRAQKFRKMLHTLNIDRSQTNTDEAVKNVTKSKKDMGKTMKPLEIDPKEFLKEMDTYEPPAAVAHAPRNLFEARLDEIGEEPPIMDKITAQEQFFLEAIDEYDYNNYDDLHNIASALGRVHALVKQVLTNKAIELQNKRQ